MQYFHCQYQIKFFKKMIKLKKNDLSGTTILDIMGRAPYPALVGVIIKGIQNVSKSHFSILPNFFLCRKNMFFKHL